MFSKTSIIMFDPTVVRLWGYVMPGSVDEGEIQKAIADYLAAVVAETNGQTLCIDIEGYEKDAQLPSDSTS